MLSGDVTELSTIDTSSVKQIGLARGHVNLKLDPGVEHHG